jgi:hypothetical protein
MGGISEVWDHFKKSGGTKAICSYCNTKIACSGGNTSSMWKHLRAKHPHYIGDQNKSGAHGGQGRNSAGTKTNPITAAFNRYKVPTDDEVTRAIAEFISEDMRPVNIVDGTGFKKFMKVVLPNYVVPSRPTVSKHVDRFYDDKRAEVEKALERATAIAVTTDCWTSLAKHGYMTVTAHFMRNDWVMRSYVLDTVEVPGKHTAENLAALLDVICVKWKIEDKVS